MEAEAHASPWRKSETTEEVKAPPIRQGTGTCAARLGRGAVGRGTCRKPTVCSCCRIGLHKNTTIFSFFATGPRHGFLLRAVAEAVQEGDCRRLDDRHYCKVVFVGTFDILSLVALVLGLRLFNDFSCGTISTRPAAQCES